MRRPLRVPPGNCAGRSRIVASALAALISALIPAAAVAHGTAPPIERWGPFLPGSVTCLRTMSQATHECFDTVLELEQGCQDARARGGTCDSAAVEARTSAAVDTMLSAVMGACAEGQLTEVGYFGFFDAEADLFDACVRQARDAVAAAYAPAAAGAPPEATAACLTTTAAYGRKVMRFILERERPVMERFATRVFAPEDKQAQVRQVESELSATRSRWTAGLVDGCPQFEAVYGRTPESFLRTLKQRTDCVLSKTYVNSALVCLRQVCGNGIVEGDEPCDDGNGDDTDACRNDCTTAGSNAGR